MDFTIHEAVIGMGVIVLVVFLMWFPTIMGLFVTLHERVGKKLEEQRRKRERRGGGDD